jgi:methylated-DNA-[protein]-cysteine S-methyltransferase
MKQVAYCLVETPLGACGLAWAEPGDSGAGPAVAFFHLPEATTKRAEARIRRDSGAGEASEPPPRIAAVIRQIRQHLAGDVQDFRDVSVDLSDAAPFARQVYQAARLIPAGQTTTYGELARAVGRPNAARAVGQALGMNPIALIIPCHRVLAAGGKVGGFSAHGGLATKAKLLAVEGVSLPPGAGTS